MWTGTAPPVLMIALSRQPSSRRCLLPILARPMRAATLPSSRRHHAFAKFVCSGRSRELLIEAAIRALQSLGSASCAAIPGRA